jgi:hypothetical protein
VTALYTSVGRFMSETTRGYTAPGLAFVGQLDQLETVLEYRSR